MGGPRIELRVERGEVRVVLARDEHVAEAPVHFRVEVIGRELGEVGHERRVRNARSEDLALEAVSGVEQPRCV